MEQCKPICVVNNMYSNTNNAFTVTLNTWETTKDKTAASKDYFQLFPGTTTEKVAVQSFLKHIIFSQYASLGTTAAAGVAGAYQDGTSKRLCCKWSRATTSTIKRDDGCLFYGSNC
jgi:hypothetical protein